MSSETSVSKKVIAAIIKKRGPQIFGTLLKQYRKVKGDDDVSFSALREAIRELSTGEEPTLSVVQFKLPDDDKFKWMVFPVGTEFIVPESETEEAVGSDGIPDDAMAVDADASASADADDALDALEDARDIFDTSSIPLNEDLFHGYLVLGQTAKGGTTADFVGSQLQAQANYLKHAADLGVSNVQLFGAVPIRFQIETYAVASSQLRAAEDDETEYTEARAKLGKDSNVQPVGGSESAAPSTVLVGAPGSASATPLTPATQTDAPPAHIQV